MEISTTSENEVLTYVAEITQPHLRGFLSATASLSALFGIFSQFLLGIFLDWRAICVVNAFSPFLSFLALCFIPESPHWLIVKGRVADAEKSLCWLRGWRKSHEVQEELRELLKTVRPEVDEKYSKKATCGESIDHYRRRTFILPFLLISFAFFVGQFSGMTTLSTFAVNIFSTFGVPVDRFFATMVLGTANLLGSCTGAILIHYTGKRPLVIASSLGSGVFLSLVAFYAHFYLGIVKLDNGAFVKEHETTGLISWLPFVFLITASYLAFMGLRFLPWILIGECYPPEIRGFASGASGSVGYIFSFAANKTFFTLISWWTLSGVYWYYGCVGILSAVIFYFCLPETEGWSLHEVQEHFAGDRNLIVAGKRKMSEANEDLGLDNPVKVSDTESKL